MTIMRHGTLYLPTDAVDKNRQHNGSYSVCASTNECMYVNERQSVKNIINFNSKLYR